MVERRIDMPAEVQAQMVEQLSASTVVTAETLLKWIAVTGWTKQEVMIHLLCVVDRYARAPISNFRVGALAMGSGAGKGKDGLGHLYMGANFELANQALSHVVHAEQAAVNNALLHGETELQFLAVSAVPCGYCRQFLYEINSAGGLILLIKSPAEMSALTYKSYSLLDLLPEPFGPEALGRQDRLMLSQAHNMSHPSRGKLMAATLAGANASYAPYSGNFSAVGLKTASGQIIVGRYAENAAFNPSLSPLQSALSQLSLSLSPQSALELVEVCLVEAASEISQRGVTENILSEIAPSAAFIYVQVAQQGNT